MTFYSELRWKDNKRPVDGNKATILVGIVFDEFY